MTTRIAQWAEAWPQICLEIAQGASLRKCCEQYGMKIANAHAWIMADPQRVRQYDLAYTVQADTIADEISDLSRKLISEGENMSSAHVQAIRVAIDSFKWQAGIRNRKKYGDRQTLELETPQDPRDAQTQLEQLRKELAPALSITQH